MLPHRMCVRLYVSLLASTAISSMSACCCRCLPVSDKLESYAVVGFSDAPKTVVRSHRVPAETQPFEPVEVWVYLCFYNQQHQPIVGREVRLTVVDAHGDPANELELRPAIVTSNDKGLNDAKVVFDPKGKVGVFRVRAEYDDKRARAIGYSPPITVLGN